jgi:hypothetical protein
MKTRKPLALILGGAACLVLGLLALFFLIHSIGGFAKVRGQLSETRAELDRLIAGDPAHDNRFPSASNVAITETNLVAARAAFTEVFGAFAGTPESAQTVEPARFPLLLNQTRDGLRDKKKSIMDTMAPDDFYYGFDQYASALPVKDDIPRLARQLLCVDAACRALFDQRIVQLVRVQRQPFDASDRTSGPGNGPTAGRTGTPSGQGKMLPPGEYLDSTGLYYRERILLTFRSHEANLWSTLNALVMLKPFCILSELSIDSRSGAPRGPGSPGSTPSGAGGLEPADADPLAASVADPETAARAKRILTHKERIVAGMGDVIEVTVGLDFIRFKPLDPDEQNRSTP